MNKGNKLLKAVFSVTLERPNMKEWRGHKVPFILYVRKHHPGGSYVWFNILGPNMLEWCKAHQRRFN